MNSPGTALLRAVAARNNADWCASVCRSHAIPEGRDDLVWCSTRRSPPYYPDAVTLRQDATAADVLPLIDTASRGASVKDSFCALDLAADGFVELFTAQWIHRPAGLLSAPLTPALSVVPVTSADRLLDWQSAWSGGDAGADVFRPAVLEDPFVRVLAVRDGEQLCGGFVLNAGQGVVGLSNLFALDAGDPAAVWSSALDAAAHHFPRCAVVGYEQGDDLETALAAGFTALGPLRVWLHTG
jgi:hypothetical protein